MIETMNATEDRKNRQEKEKDARKRLEVNEDHPFWKLDFWHDIIYEWRQLLLCSLLLFVSGMLCASAGIGGNIIQVTVLMAGGSLTPADAVPVSKVVILLGALGSLAVHCRSKAWSGETLPVPLICWDSCRVAVPACLLGTSLGVAVNPRVPDKFLVMLLAVFLFCIAVWVIWQTLVLWNAEVSSSVQTNDNIDIDGTDSLLRAITPPLVSTPVFQRKPAPNATFDTVAGMVILLMLVVTCGIMRELTENCHDAAHYLGWWATHKHCNHPFLKIALFGEVDGRWFVEHHKSVTAIATALPVLACFIYGGAAAHGAESSMSLRRIAVIQLVVFSLGFLGALTGIGGGVVLSPFFLVMGLNVQRTVATSVVCVIFIAASSALQYIITNRVRMAFALMLGLVNAVGSCAGAIMMHKMAGVWARSSFIMAIIAFLVTISFAITLHNFIAMVA